MKPAVNTEKSQVFGIKIPLEEQICYNGGGTEKRRHRRTG